MAWYAEKWKNPTTIVKTVLSNAVFWGSDLSTLPGFEESVLTNLNLLEQRGAAAIIKEFAYQETGQNI